MPSWQPEWRDVQFDHGAAAAYADACETTAQRLQHWIAERESAARQAVVHWEGPHRVSFDRQLAELHGQARTAAVSLLGEAAEVQEASASASREQARRLEERQRWLREQAWEAEQARAEQARAEAARSATGTDTGPRP